MKDKSLQKGRRRRTKRKGNRKCGREGKERELSMHACVRALTFNGAQLFMTQVTLIIIIKINKQQLNNYAPPVDYLYRIPTVLKLFFQHNHSNFYKSDKTSKRGHVIVM